MVICPYIWFEGNLSIPQSTIRLFTLLNSVSLCILLSLFITVVSIVHFVCLYFEGISEKTFNFLLSILTFFAFLFNIP